MVKCMIVSNQHFELTSMLKYSTEMVFYNTQNQRPALPFWLNMNFCTSKSRAEMNTVLVLLALYSLHDFSFPIKPAETKLYRRKRLNKPQKRLHRNTAHFIENNAFKLPTLYWVQALTTPLAAFMRSPVLSVKALTSKITALCVHW